MKKSLAIPRLLIAAAAIGAMALAAASPANAGRSSSAGGASGDGYNAIPSKVSGNVTSVSFEGAPAKEFGDKVALGGTTRQLASISVLFSSWGCEAGGWNTNDCETTPGATFDVPITFTVYDASGTEVIASKSPIITIPYRPSVSPICATIRGLDGKLQPGKWYNSKDRMCYNGLPNKVTVDMSDLGKTLPDQVIWSVQYNTTTSGYTPVSNATCVSEPGGCGYDSLNVGAFSYPNAPFAGTDLDENEAFYDGVMESGWTGYRPLGAIATR